MKVELGDEVKDLVSGFRGIATASSSYLNGCDRIHVQPPIKKDGKHPDGLWVDEPQLKVLKKKKVVIKLEKDPVTKVRKTGGPRINPPMGR